MTKKPIPKTLAMVVCDTVIDDKKTGKKSLINMFNNINAKSTPCVHPRLNVYISLTEGHGEYKGTLKFINEDEDKIIADVNGPIIFKSPHQIIEFNFEIVGLPIPQFGNYRFDFYCNDELAISRKFIVSQLSKAK